MRHSTLALLVIFPSLSLAAPAAKPEAKIDPKPQVDAVVAPAVDGRWVTGLSVGVVDAAGASHVYGYGRVALAGPARAPDGDTLFEIGSASKVFTSLLLSILVERKLVSLDDPVAKYLPGTVTMPSFGGHAITLAHLATHTSGLPRMPNNLRPKDPENPYADYTAEQLYAFLSSYTLTREPGAVYDYSNLGAGLLGHVVSLVGKSPYEALLTERIARPLGMASTRITLGPADRARFAEPHDGDGTTVAAWDFTTLAGAGGIRSTANDMLRFVRANLGIDPSPLAAAMKLQRERRHDAPPLGGIALGWHVRDDGTVWHNGQTAGFHSYVAFDPAKRVGVVVLANSASGVVDDVGYQVLRALRGETPKPLALKQHPPEPALTAAQLDGFLGSYELAPGFAIDVRRAGDHLVAQATGQPSFRLFAETADHFYLRVVPAEIDFHRDAAGQVTELVLHQNGRDLPGKRKPR